LNDGFAATFSSRRPLLRSVRRPPHRSRGDSQPAGAQRSRRSCYSPLDPPGAHDDGAPRRCRRVVKVQVDGPSAHNALGVEHDLDAGAGAPPDSQQQRLTCGGCGPAGRRTGQPAMDIGVVLGSFDVAGHHELGETLLPGRRHVQFHVVAGPCCPEHAEAGFEARRSHDGNGGDEIAGSGPRPEAPVDGERALADLQPTRLDVLQEGLQVRGRQHPPPPRQRWRGWPEPGRRNEPRGSPRRGHAEGPGDGRRPSPAPGRVRAGST